MTSEWKNRRKSDDKEKSILFHSHWDREWYLPYEEHHMRIELVDNVLDLIENDPEFNSFHLDGQTIILDDYLQVRPEKRSRKKAVQAGKTKNRTILYFTR